MSPRIFRASLYALVTLAAPSLAFACDLCAIYNSIETHSMKEGSLHFGVAEQFTAYEKLQDGGKKIENTNQQHMESSITQLFGSYDLNDRIGFQVSLPYINRRFKRLAEGEIQRGTEAGIGDLSLIARAVPFRYSCDSTHVRVGVFGGVKLPTGDSDRLKEELEAEHEEELHEGEEVHIERHAGHHHEEPSAVHGHDLALGSGSYDFPVGVNFFAQHDRLFLSSDVQYAIRTQGDSYYQYANDLLWSVGPGVYFLLAHEYTAALRVNLSGEYKGKDEGKSNVKQDDTAINSLFLGPELIVSVRDKLSVDLGWDVPMNIQNSGIQAVPSYRLRAAITYRF